MLRDWFSYSFLFIAAVLLSSASAAQGQTGKIEGHYKGTWSLSQDVYTFRIPLLPRRDLDPFADHLDNLALNRLTVYFDTDSAAEGAELAVFVHQDRWFLKKASKPEMYDSELAQGEVKDYFGMSKTGTQFQLDSKLLPGAIVQAWSKRLDGLESTAGEKKMVVVPVTIQEGIEDNEGIKGNLNTAGGRRRNKLFQERNQLAQKAGLDLATVLNQFYAAKCDGNDFFLLYYNKTKANGCDHQYLIQTVKLTKTFYDENGIEKNRKVEHLVEAFKLNAGNKQKGADGHLKRYSLQGAHKRKLVAEYEIGWGSIPGKAQGKAWPFDRGIKYICLQDYAEQPGLYPTVQFVCSYQYTVTFEFDKTGKYTLDFGDAATPEKVSLGGAAVK